MVSYSAGDIPGATVHLLGSYPSMWERELTRAIWAFRGLGSRGSSTINGVLSSVRASAGQAKRSVRTGLHGLSCRGIIGSLRPDIVHGFGMINHAVYAGLAGFRPLVAHAMGSDVLVDSRHDAEYWRLARFAADRAQVITSECQTMTDALVSVLGVPRNKIRTFAWGVDIQTFRPGHEVDVVNLKRQLEIEDGAPVIVSQKALVPNSNIDVIINAIPQVLRNHPKAVFLLLRGVGSTTYDVEMRRMVGALGVESQVRFVTEFLAPEAVATLFNLSDIVVSIPKSDAMAISLREAMACGAIPIVGGLPDNREIVEDGKYGYILDTIDPKELAQVLNDCLDDLPALKAHFMEINPPYIVREHNWEETTRKMEELYREVLTGYPHSASGS